MKSLLRRSAELVFVSGIFLSLGSCAVDAATCSGELVRPSTGESFSESGPGTSPVVVCDEDPRSEAHLLIPGTTEQKLVYTGISLATLGAAGLFLTTKDEAVESEADDFPSL